MHTHLLCAPSVITSTSKYSLVRHESPFVSLVGATCSSQSLTFSLQSTAIICVQKVVRVRHNAFLSNRVRPSPSMLRFSRGASMSGVKKRSALMAGVSGRQHVTEPQSKRLKVQARREAKILPPPGHNVIYRVQEDDTLIGIARHLRCSLEDLVVSNPHLTSDLDFILEDQHVIIPSHVWTGVTPAKFKGRIEILAAGSAQTAPEEGNGRGQLQYVVSIRASNPPPPPHPQGTPTGPWSQKGLQVLLLGIGLLVAALAAKLVKEGKERKETTLPPSPTRSSPPTPPLPSRTPIPQPPTLPPLSPPTIIASVEEILKEDVGSPMKEGGGGAGVVASEKDLEGMVKGNVGLPKNFGVEAEETEVQLAEYGSDVQVRTREQMVRDKAGRLPSAIELKGEGVREGKERLEAMAALAPASAGLYFDQVLKDVRNAPSAQPPPPPSPSDLVGQVAGAAGQVLAGPLPTSAELKSLSLGGKMLNPSPEIAPSVAGLYFEQIEAEVQMGRKEKMPPGAGGAGGGGGTSVPLQLEVLTGEGALSLTGPEEEGLGGEEGGVPPSDPRATPVAAVGQPPELSYPTNQAVPAGMMVKTSVDAQGNTVSLFSMGTAVNASLAPYKKAAPAAKASPRAGGTVGGVFRNAVPAVVVGVGLTSSISGGPEGALVMIGLTALLNFALNDLLLADSRAKLWESVRTIQTHEQLMRFLNHRDIIPRA